MLQALSSAFGALVLGGLILFLMTAIILLISDAMKPPLGLDLTPSQHFFDLLRERPLSTPIA